MLKCLYALSLIACSNLAFADEPSNGAIQKEESKETSLCFTDQNQCGPRGCIESQGKVICVCNEGLRLNEEGKCEEEPLCKTCGDHGRCKPAGYEYICACEPGYARIDGRCVDLGVKWVSIQGGSYNMGTKKGAPHTQPLHQVHVPDFSVSMTEVTTTQYRACVDAGVCQITYGDDVNGFCNFGDPAHAREDHPINCISWTEALRFAEWANARLLTEAEWEYAAGGKAKRSYPWGEQKPSTAIVNYGDRIHHTTPVCSLKKGNTKEGLCDMAGNVCEWVQDSWSDTYADHPTDGSAFESDHPKRICRGGGWNNATLLHTTDRLEQFDRSDIQIDIGLRLAK